MDRPDQGGKRGGYGKWLGALSILAAALVFFKAAKAKDHGPSQDSLEAQREVKDMGHLWVALFGGALFLGLATLLAFLWGVQTALGRPPEPPGLRAEAIAHAGDSATVMRFRSRAPGLFPDPPGDLRRFEAAQAAQAPAYAWVDRRSGIISIPVERAMDRIAAAGWPDWAFPGVAGGAAAQPVAPADAEAAEKGGP
jgi:hypothetical protein